MAVTAKCLAGDSGRDGRRGNEAKRRSSAKTCHSASHEARLRATVANGRPLVENRAETSYNAYNISPSPFFFFFFFFFLRRAALLLNFSCQYIYTRRALLNVR